MNSNDLRKKRADKIALARVLVDKADAEGRDFTETERTEYETLMGKDEKGVKGAGGGEVGKLAQTIEEREALEAHEKELSEHKSEPVKPQGNQPDGSAMKRADFEKLDAEARAKFLRDGGHLED